MKFTQPISSKIELRREIMIPCFSWIYYHLFSRQRPVSQITVAHGWRKSFNTGATGTPVSATPNMPAESIDGYRAAHCDGLCCNRARRRAAVFPGR
jgi:hypothetical protein